MTDREFWLTVRRALLMICKAIEQRYLLPVKIDLPENESTSLTIDYTSK